MDDELLLYKSPTQDFIFLLIIVKTSSNTIFQFMSAAPRRPGSFAPVSVAKAQNTYFAAPSSRDKMSFDNIFKDISLALSNIDFERFFKVFDLQSPVCQFVEQSNLAELKALMLKAFPETNPEEGGSVAISSTKKAKKMLDGVLTNLSLVFKDIEKEGFDIGTVRSSIAWLKERNQQTLQQLENSVPKEKRPSEDNDDHISYWGPQTIHRVNSRRHSEVPNGLVIPPAQRALNREYCDIFAEAAGRPSSTSFHCVDPFTPPPETTTSPKRKTHARDPPSFPKPRPVSYLPNRILSPSPISAVSSLADTYNRANGIDIPRPKAPFGHNPSSPRANAHPPHVPSHLPSQTVYSPSPRTDPRRRQTLAGPLPTLNLQHYHYHDPSRNEYDPDVGVFIPPPPSSLPQEAKAKSPRKIFFSSNNS